VIVLGDVAATLAFGSIAFLGIIGSFVLDAKKARQYAAAWPTSNVPFFAIICGRQHLPVREIGLRRIAAGLGVSVITLALDTLLSNASLFANARIAFR